MEPKLVVELTEKESDVLNACMHLVVELFTKDKKLRESIEKEDVKAIATMMQKFSDAVHLLGWCKDPNCEVKPPLKH